jgi:signal transduction histidine kinase
VSNRLALKKTVVRNKVRQSTNEALDRLDRRLRILNECYRTYFRVRSEQELLQSICDILVSDGELRLAWFGYCEDNAEKVVRPVAKAGSGLDYLDQVRISWGNTEVGQGPVGIAIRSGRPCSIDDINTDPRFAPRRAAAVARGYASCIALPLIADSESHGALNLHGSLNLYSARHKAFDEKMIPHYTDLASYATFAVTAFRRDLAEDLIYGTTALRASEERRRAQEAQRAARAELERLTNLMAKGEMAAAIAHEINQPLAAIVTNGNAAMRWLARTPPDLDEARTAVTRIVSDGHHASQVIGSIRGMFKEDSREQVPLDVNQILREIVALVDPELRSQRVSVHLELAERLPQVLGDRVQLKQVIFNLVMNAVDAMSAVADRARVLRINSAAHKPDFVQIAVEDSGTGIDPKSIDRIFDPFFTTKSRGMGMGLSICRSIVEAHHGRLWALHGVHHGSIFRIELPVARSENQG